MTQVDVSEAYWRRMAGLHHPPPCFEIAEYVRNDVRPEDAVIVPSRSDYAMVEEPMGALEWILSAVIAASYRVTVMV